MNELNTEDTSRDVSRTPRRTSCARERNRERDIEANLALDDAGPVPQDIPPIPGFDLMWIRIQDGNQPATRNVMDADRHGWVPVDPKEIGTSFAHMMVQSERLGNVIGTHDMVLYKRPTKYGDIQRKALKQRVVEKTNAIKAGMRQELGGTNMNFVDDSTRQTEIGRRAEVAPDN